MLTKVALIGRPVAESLSPRMQNAAFAALGLDWTYLAFDVGDPAAAVRALETLGFAGANVTIPHKRAVAALCDEAEGDAVNTLVFSDGRVLGFNTDREILAGITLEARLPDRRRRGRAGPARGAAGRHARLHPLRDVASRRARAATSSSTRPRCARSCSSSRSPARSSSISPTGRDETALVAAARRAGCEVVDGREALVRQGAASFRIWTGLEPPLDVMRRAITP